MTAWRVIDGDALTRLRELEAGSVQTCVTSPPYFGLRDYGTGKWAGGSADCDHRAAGERRQLPHGDGRVRDSYAEERHLIAGAGALFKGTCGKCGATRTDSQIGLEPTPDEYVQALVGVFREVRRVLRDDGTLWLNLGDSYASGFACERRNVVGNGSPDADTRRANRLTGDLKEKDLMGIPWAVAEALRDPYYTGRIGQERDRVWMAAMIDGEGTICGFHHERADGDGVRTGVNLCITNSSEALLAEAERIWPASRCEHMSRDGALGSKPCWRWLVHGIENKTEFLREVYPHLIVKRKQAVLAYNLLVLMADAKRLGHSPQRDAVREKRALLVRLMSEANKSDCDVPSWCVEPPSMFEPGWYLRSDIIWSKPNPMPESVTDRPTKAHEYLFLLSKGPRYFYDADAVREPYEMSSWTAEADAAGDTRRGLFGARSGEKTANRADEADGTVEERHRRMGATSMAGAYANGGRNKRSVWTVATQPFPGAHFAVFPPKLIEPCVLAGSAERCCGVCGVPWRRVVDVGFEPSCDHHDRIGAIGTASSVVLDPFAGAGTTGLVATRHGRGFIGIELNGTYAELARNRIRDDAPLFNSLSEVQPTAPREAA